jgi:hypothetical protein
MSHNHCRTEYDFTLILTGVNALSQAVVDALYESGCDDATPSLRFGRVYLTFSRQAKTMAKAILSAIRDVRKAGIGADVLRVDPCNLVTQSEIAHRIRLSRQRVHQYIMGTRGPGGFPPPACNIADESPLWYWCDVAHWLRENNLLPEQAYREAQDVALINAQLEFRRQCELDSELCKEIQEALK